MKRKDGKLNWVLIISLIVCIVITLWAIIFPAGFGSMASALMGFITAKFGWLYMIAVGLFLFFCIFMAVSKYGKINLGHDGEKPDYSTVSWFAMLFSSGMGIGLIFWGVAEPVTHYTTALTTNPFGVTNAGEFAITKSFLHWCLHPWAIFCVVGLGLAYMVFRKDKPMLISSIFIPLLGEKRCKGWLGQLIDIISVFATVAGVCTSLGLGTMQINGGLNMLFGIPESKVVQIIIIVVISFLFTFTAAVGIEKGISVVADINMILCVVMMVLCFVVGPTVFELNILSDGIGSYLATIIQDSFRIGAYSEAENAWLGGWTIFYWAWWVAWGPFCGCFIARISKGRSIREFVAGVMVVPALLSMIWFAIMGGLGLNLGEEICALAAQNSATACFVVFLEYPLGKIISGICLCLVVTFFVTSANSATFVLGMYTSEGDLNPRPVIKTIWGIIEAAFALFLLLATDNGLSMMQTTSIAGAFPFLLVMIFSMAAILKAVSKDEIFALDGDLAIEEKEVKGAEAAK